MVALATWVTSAGVGLYLLVRWLVRRRTPTRLMWFHLATALTGLAVWITYLSTDRPTALAWVAFGVLFLNNDLGDRIGTGGWRHRNPEGRQPRLRATLELLSGKRPIALTHALLAGTTFFLVLFTALGF
ncbi:hypothetical protein ACFQV2_17655 [Actinokineospora soli]|uniref:Uncharacterized protein n=1 Tax=Actinokineospora soli TaxID=1048753 RepID=A0ABW2TN03_9PSEU